MINSWVLHGEKGGGLLKNSLFLCPKKYDPQADMIKYTPQYLKKLEEIFNENGYKVRFEKGNFKSGFCIMEDRKMIMINKFAVIESRIGTMLEILKLLYHKGDVSGENCEEALKSAGIDLNVEDRAG
jgi:hypothetical protein